MNGAHDLGGMQGFGPVAPEPDEPVFHHEWERRAFALTLAASVHGRWNLDEARHARENRHPVDYLTSTYYELWIKGLERLLARHGLVTAEELARGRALAERPPGLGPAPDAAAMAAGIARGASARRAEALAPRFQVGDAVRVRNRNPTSHTRAPRYCRGRIGEVARDHGVFVFPDANAHGRGPAPQHCYSVRFRAPTLWGDGASPRDAVYVDLWDDHLEACR
jgi:nitrile hydratase